MLARRFLWIIAIIVMIVIAAAISYALFGERLLRAALVPSVPYSATAAGAAPDYAAAKAWIARPDLPSDPSRWTPLGHAAAPRPGIAVFFVTPTGAFDRSGWNARTDDPAVEKRLGMFLRLQASLFNSVASVWAPRYRQATFGAFLTEKPEAQKAIDLAYGDVSTAFEAFLAAQPADRPIILAGHSQGSLHIIRLLKDRIAGTDLTRRIIAVYLPGWPISVTADLPALGLPACTRPDQTGCILSWQSFASPADYKSVREVFDRGIGYAGVRRLGTEMLCVNPLTGNVNAKAAPPQGNFGALVPNADFSGGTLQAKSIGARCLPTGILDIGQPPAGFNSYVLPGNNYHVYDFPLFWANLRGDVERRADGFHTPAAPRRDARARVGAA
jgi:hypothetical protein